MSEREGLPPVGGTMLAAAACLAFVALVVVSYWFWLPDAEALRRGNPMTTQYVQLFVRRNLAKGRRPAVLMRWIPLESISPYLRSAVLIAEDDGFYRHRGVDWAALKTAARYNLQRRKLARGGSTITQQTARNLFLSPSRRFGRKLKEVLIARYLERTLDKDRILEIYLNTAEWGEGVFGAEAASLVYFGKRASELTPEEAVALVVALPSPYRLNPAKPPVEKTLKKKELFLDRMRRSGVLLEHPTGYLPTAEE